MTPMSKQSSLTHRWKSANLFHSYHRFFVRVDRVLRRSLGVSETARTKVDIKPAPEIDPTEPEEEVPETPQYFSEEMLRDSFTDQVVFDKDTDEKIHDEL